MPMTDVSRGVGTRKERLFEHAVCSFSYDGIEMWHKSARCNEKSQRGSVTKYRIKFTSIN